MKGNSKFALHESSFLCIHSGIKRIFLKFRSSGTEFFSISSYVNLKFNFFFKIRFYCWHISVSFVLYFAFWMINNAEITWIMYCKNNKWRHQRTRYLSFACLWEWDSGDISKSLQFLLIQFQFFQNSLPCAIKFRMKMWNLHFFLHVL